MDLQTRGAVLVVSRSEAVVRAARAGAGRNDIDLAPGVEGLRARLRQAGGGGYRAVVFELRAGVRSHEAADLADDLSAAVCPVIVTTQFGPGCGVAIRQLVLRRSDLAFALDCGVDLTRMVREACGSTPPQEETALIIAEVSPHVPSLARDTFTTTAILGVTGCDSERVAAAVEVNRGTLDDRLRQIGSLTIHAQLAWRRSLRAVYRVTEQRQAVADAAGFAGWESREACAHAVKACTGRSLKDWRAAGGFNAALAAYVEAWHSRREARLSRDSARPTGMLRGATLPIGWRRC